EAIAAAPNEARLYRDRGSMYLAKDFLDLAEADFTTALRLQPSLAEVEVYLGDLYTRKGDTPAALWQYDRVLEAYKYYPLAFHHRGIAKSKLGDTDGAIADFDMALKINPLMSRALVSRGSLQRRKGSFTAAIADYTEAIRLSPESSAGYNGL